MHRLRVYVDTSVFGGVEDEEFSNASRRFFADVHAGKYIVLLSEEVYRELEDAPPSVREVLLGLPRDCIEDVSVADEAEELRNAYLQAGVLGKASENDALHVATATEVGADVIVSWNFRHIVNRKRIHMYNAVNVAEGYRPLEIYSPYELEGDDE